MVMLACAKCAECGRRVVAVCRAWPCHSSHMCAIVLRGCRCSRLPTALSLPKGVKRMVRVQPSLRSMMCGVDTCVVVVVSFCALTCLGCRACNSPVFQLDLLISRLLTGRICLSDYNVKYARVCAGTGVWLVAVC